MLREQSKDFLMFSNISQLGLYSLLLLNNHHHQPKLANYAKEAVMNLHGSKKQPHMLLYNVNKKYKWPHIYIYIEQMIRLNFSTFCLQCTIT